MFGSGARYAFVGSFNLDARSVALNTELGMYFESDIYGKQLAEQFAEFAMVNGYRVLLGDDGDLLWKTWHNKQEIVYDVEPETSTWERFVNRFLSAFVPESQL